MSISGALSNALSGLTAAARSSEIVASNISNATTEGFGTRTLVLSPRSTGGVTVEGVQRAVAPALIAERRLADAEQGQKSDILEALIQIEKLTGSPLDAGSLVSRATAFEAALIEAGSRPDSSVRLDQVVQTADMLATKFRDISEGLQSIRQSADKSIASQVEQLNDHLEQVRLLNKRIVSSTAQGLDTASLLDARQGLVDRISKIVPVSEVPRDTGAIALFSKGGAILLDVTAVEIGFVPVNLVTPDMTQASGALSGLSINSRPISTDPSFGSLRGGRLDAALQIRDTFAVQAQIQLDAAARDLVERFSSPGLDSTLAPGQPGVFTDDGLAFDPVTEVGLAGRLSINPQIDPAAGGQQWRIRDGMAAPSPGPVGHPTRLQAMSDALKLRRAPQSGDFDFGAFSFPELAARILSETATSRQFAEQHQSFAATRATALRQSELEQGVDTDDQLQRLLQIEQAYAANARVIQTVGEMMDSLLRI